MITKFLANSLKEIYHQAKQAGADSIEITNEDNEIEVYLMVGDTGIGKTDNSMKEALYKLRKKDTVKLKGMLGANKVQYREYQHFGEWAFKLTITI
jgi:signal recognition particle GTPase